MIAIRPTSIVCLTIKIDAMIADIMSDIMASANSDKEQNSPEIENHLREKRQSAGLSQKQLADMAGITRQAVSAVEANQYSPATSVALQLARALRCRVEDLFSHQERRRNH